MGELFEPLTKESALNRIGLFTRKQIEEKDKRVQDLWFILSDLRGIIVLGADLPDVDVTADLKKCVEKIDSVLVPGFI